MYKKLTVLLAAAFLALTVNPAFAGWSLGGYLEHLSLDSETAAQEGVEDTALALGFSADYFSERLMAISLGTAFVVYDDNREFRQLVEVDGGFDDGDIRSESSDASALLIYADFGPRFAFGADNSSHFAAKVGFANFLYSERSIGFCENCYEEDIDIDGGAYIQTALGHSFGRVNLGFMYNRYLDEDKGVSDSFRFLVSAGF